MKIFEELSNLIGHTPLIEIEYKFDNKIRKARAKLEWFGLSGSIKDRAALNILKNAYLRKELSPGQTICETTSGNMGISLSAISCYCKNPIVICLPKYLSVERQKLLSLYGAHLELTEDFDEAFLLAEKYKKEGAFLTYQFKNYDNLEAHRQTAKEIMEKTRVVPCFVSGVGTGGTLMGTGKELKKHCHSLIYAIDPEEAGLLQFGKSRGSHKIQGLSDGRLPELYDHKSVDKIIPIKSDDAIKMAQKLCTQLGLGVGISSGANFLGCVLSGINFATTVFPDDNKKYLSTDLALKIDSPLVERIDLLSYLVI